MRLLLPGWTAVSEEAAEHGWALARCTCIDDTPVTTADIEAAVVEVQERFCSAPVFAIAAGVDCMALAAYLAAHQGACPASLTAHSSLVCSASVTKNPQLQVACWLYVIV